MPGDALHRSDDRPLPPAFTQRSSRGPEPTAGEQPLMAPYFHGDRDSYAASTPSPPAARAAVAAGAATEDWGDEPWASTPDYEDAPPPPAAKPSEPAPITDFLVVEEAEPEPQPVEAFLEEVVDPVRALVQGVTLLDEPEAPAEPIDADTLAYVEAVALGEAASTNYGTADAAADVTALDASLDAPASEAMWSAPAESGHDMAEAEPRAAEPAPTALDIGAEAAEAASAASAWPAEVLAAISAPGSERAVTPAPVDVRPARPAELEPPIELQPVGFEALASEILAGAPAAPAQDAAATERPAAPAGEPEARGAHTAPPAAPAPITAFDGAPPSMALTPAAAPGAVLDPAALELVERLEAAAQRLREHGAAGLAVDLLNGDRFDAMLAGVLTGFLAARRG